MAEEQEQFNHPDALEAHLAQMGISPETPRVQAHQEEAFAVQGGTFFFNSEVEDGAGNNVTGWGTLDVSVGYAYMALKEKGTGRVMADTVVIPDAGQKCDTGHMWLKQDERGAFVRLRFGDHKPGAGQPEDLSRDIYDWYAPGLVPIGPGEPRMGRPGAYQVEETGGSGLNEAETITAVKKAQGTDPKTLLEAWGGTPGEANKGFREKFRELVATAIIRYLDPRNRNRPDGQYADAAAFQDTLFGFFRNALYGLIRKHIFGSWARHAEPGYEVETIEYQQKQIAIIHYAMRHYSDGGALLYQETLQPMGAQAPEGAIGTPSQAVEEGEN